MNLEQNHINYMSQAIALAKKGLGYTNPNPIVGSVIVKNGNIVGSGYHQAYGSHHAEVYALQEASDNAKGATMYVTLEPCSHHGKTPPCAEAIIQSGISTVVIGCTDPNPKVSGKGIQLLQSNGIEVITGILEQECMSINDVFFHYIRTGLPYIVMKYAMTLDGKIATHTGASKYITSSEALQSVHLDRHRYSAIMVGVNTILKDDPLLTCRIMDKPNIVNPIRIVCDTSLRTPLTSKLIATAKDVPTIIATSITNQIAISAYQQYGVTILNIKKDQTTGSLHIPTLLKELAGLGIDSILLEGGATLHWAVLSAKAVNKIKAYVAPKIFGGATALSPIAGLGVDTPSQAISIINTTATAYGPDILLEGDVVYN